MNPTTQKIQEYRLNDAIQHLYLIPVFNALVIVYDLVVFQSDAWISSRFVYSVATFLLSIVVIKYFDFKRTVEAVSALVGYFLLFVGEFYALDVPEMSFGVGGHGMYLHGRGIMLAGFIGIVPYIYLVAKALICVVIIRLAYLLYQK